MQEYARENYHAEHHGKGWSVVRVSRPDESFKLGVFERANRYLGDAVQIGQAQTIVVDDKFVHAVDVGHLEIYTVTTFNLQCNFY